MPFSVGVAYQSKMSMGEFDDYSDLFAGGRAVSISRPASRAAFRWVASDALRINFDVEHTTFSEVDSMANPMAEYCSVARRCPSVARTSKAASAALPVPASVGRT